MTTYFKTKDQYLSFKKTWASAVNGNGSITSAHHLFYNIIRGMPIERGFALVTNENKLYNGACVNQGLYFAYLDLNSMVNTARRVKKESLTEDNPTFSTRRFKVFFSPFAEHMDIEYFLELLKDVDVPKVRGINYSYPMHGREIISHILTQDTPITYQELWDMYEDLNGKEAA